jgi:hypothetical protein
MMTLAALRPHLVLLLLFVVMVAAVLLQRRPRHDGSPVPLYGTRL